MNTAVTTWLFVILAVLAGAFLLVLRIFARMIVGLTHSVTAVKIRSWSRTGDRVVLRADRFTRSPGEYALWWNDRRGHARIGRVVGEDTRAGTVEREVLGRSGVAASDGKGDWNGFVFAGPGDLGLPWSDVTIPTENGPAPAWHFPGDTGTWVIHVHGIRVSRLSPLRGVPVFSREGYHSLVVSYRGDGEAPATRGGSSTLGVAEWPDIEPAIDYAVEHGAERILLCGWSMGGGMVLLAAERARNRAAIDGLVLVAPAADWREVVLYGARQARVPEALGRLVIAGLSARGWSRLLGAAEPIDFDALDWVTRDRPVTVPTLIVQSPADDEVPIALNRALAEKNDTVQLAEIGGAFHTLEWNRDREAFDDAIGSWARKTARTR